jgi:hypothetical protein
MDDIDDLFEELNSLRKKHKQDMTQSYQKMSDYVMNMDFASLYPSTIMTMHSPSKNKKILKINKILDNINDNKRI